MKLAIHRSDWGFSRDVIQYCELHGLSYKLVNCYDNDIVQQLHDCDIFFWHHHHSDSKDVLFAKQLLFALQQAGKSVFPDFNSGWHFDDKVGQKYLLESIDAPLVNSYVFYDKRLAVEWARQATFPKVFKLRGGAGSNNVRLVRSVGEAERLIRKSFGRGFSSYNRWVDLREKIRLYRLGRSTLKRTLKSVRRVFVSTAFARTVGRHKGYVYFQDFVPANTFDIRVITIGNRAFAIKRFTRKNDFRASGSGLIQYDREGIPEDCVRIAFQVTERMKATVVAYDFVFDSTGKPLVVEINYGYAHQAYFECPGYWDRDLVWHEGKFNSVHWIVEKVIEDYKNVHR